MPFKQDTIQQVQPNKLSIPVYPFYRCIDMQVVVRFWLAYAYALNWWETASHYWLAVCIMLYDSRSISLPAIDRSSPGPDRRKEFAAAPVGWRDWELFLL